MNETQLAVTAIQELIAWYEDNIYDGPPGPQDDEGGNGEPFAIFNARCTLDSIGGGQPHRCPELRVGPAKEGKG